MKKLLFLIFTLFLFIPFVNAEEFNQANRFQYYTYYNGTTLRDNGTGLMNLYYGPNSSINRIQWLYQLYTFDSNYLYDITFTTYYTINNSNSGDWITAFANSCDIYTGTGSYYQCYLNSGRQNNKDYVEMTILNMQGTNSNTLWLNLYSSLNTSVYIPQLSYSLQIVRKEDNKATSDDIYNATDNVINNNNANTDKVIDNQNKNQEQTNSYLDAQINSQNQTNEKLDNITDSNVDDPSSSINSFQNMLASNGVITQLVTLPVTLFSKVLNSVNGTCSNYNLGSLLGTDLILPCINIQNYLGSTLWSVIDVLISGLFVYAISRKFIKVFENLSSMKDGDVISD